MQKLIRKNIISLILLILFSVLLSACRSSEPEFDIDAQKTGFALTADVQATLTSAARPTATETPVPLPTYTPTTEPTRTPINTSTPAGGIGTPTSGGFNRAQVIAQVPEDNTRIAPGEAFTVTWTLENKGTTTWTVNYYIAHASGEQMGATEKVFIWLPVPPETSLPLTVNFLAPTTAGSKVSNWKMYDANGTAFYDFSVTIVVGD
jgi:hypothetical protein